MRKCSYLTVVCLACALLYEGIYSNAPKTVAKTLR